MLLKHIQKAIEKRKNNPKSQWLFSAQNDADHKILF